MIRVVVRTDNGFEFDEESVIRAVRQTVRDLGWNGVKTETVVSVVGEREMIKLQKKHMHKPKATDVLSFPLAESNLGEKPLPGPDGITRLGDVVICYPVALKQAVASGKTTNEEMAFLADHGTRHLLGQHHGE